MVGPGFDPSGFAPEEFDTGEESPAPGAVLRIGALPGGMSGTALQVPVPPVTEDLAGSINGQSVLSATLDTGILDLAGTLPGLGGFSGTLLVISFADLSGLIPGQSTLSATLDVIAELAGTLDGVGQLTGELDQEGVVDLTGTIPGQGGLTGTPTCTLEISGTIPGQGTLDAALDLVRDLAGSIPGQSATLASLDVSGQMEGFLPGQGTLQGTVSYTAEMGGTLAAQGTLLGALDVISFGYEPSPLRMRVVQHERRVYDVEAEARTIRVGAPQGVTV